MSWRCADAALLGGPAAGKERAPGLWDGGGVRIAVDQIPATGKTVDLTLREPWVVAAAEASAEARPSAVSGALVVAPPAAYGRVEVRASVRVAAPATCHRCGEDMELQIAAERELSYAPEDGSAPREREVEADELDLGWYTGGALDLADVLREVVALALPPRVLCADEVACEARTTALLASSGPSAGGHPGFAALAGLRARAGGED